MTLRLETDRRDGRPRPALVVGDDGGWFLPPAGARIDLSESTYAARLLLHLAKASIEGPRPVSTAELFRVGWPGERAIPHAGAHRVYVLLSRLRGLGLSPVLRRRDGGYVLIGPVQLAS